MNIQDEQKNSKVKGDESHQIIDAECHIFRSETEKMRTAPHQAARISV